MASAGIQGLATRKWDKEIYSSIPAPNTRADLLRLWDEVTAKIDAIWPQIPPGRFEEIDLAFGQWEGLVYGLFQVLDRQRDPSPRSGVRVSAISRDSSHRRSTNAADRPALAYRLRRG